MRRVELYTSFRYEPYQFRLRFDGRISPIDHDLDKARRFLRAWMYGFNQCDNS